MTIARSRLTDQRSRRGLAGALFCVAVTVAGCAAPQSSAAHSGHASQAGHNRAATSPSSAATSPSSAATSPLSTATGRAETGTGKSEKALAAAYRAIALPANRRLDKENGSYQDSEHDNFVIAKRDLCGEIATERNFDTKLLKIDFPADIAATAWALVQANNQRIALTERQASAPTIAKLRSFDQRHKAADAAVEVQVRIIRQDLGLPPPDNS